ncbi:DUF3298 and DUF4163 domain-containing protein [Microbulbifer halophilus]|uniref:DUF3298 domain-containing protein n=1 Tax=Microbulbifer halophilus TaxID=453963 RepID=A0ABW5EFP5_9GAMM|nr:DUF3298 and DUF4163 domain-containing protein [Microbulbifer halophilus]MCW8128254.1 DUF3298 domain-containing protein [Microbulbifer halophilus]
MPLSSNASFPVALSRVTALLALLLAAGCDNRGDETKPGKLQVRQESFELRAPDCKGEECPSVSVDYQLFENRPALNNAIREQLAQQLQGFAEEAGSPGSVAAAAEAFLQQAERAPEDTGNRWHMQGNGKLLGRSGKLVTIEIGSYAYTGGAHGIPTTHWLNWDLEAGEPVALEQIIRPGQEAAFWDLARAAHERWLEEEANIDEEFRQGWPFARTENFHLDKKGLTLLYGVYELGPYAMGQVQLTIPRDKLDKVVREEYLAE